MKRTKNIRRIATLCCFTLITSLVLLHAQSVSWSGGFPKLSPNSHVTILGDESTLQLKFSVAQSNINTASIQVELPPKFTAGAVSPASQFDATTAGQLVTITPKSGAFAKDEEVTVDLKVGALCDALSTTPIKVTVLHGTKIVKNGAKEVSVSPQTPNIVLTAPQPTFTYASKTDVKVVTINVSATDGEANSATIFLDVDNTTTLSDFKIATTALTATTPTHAGGKRYQLELTPANLGGKIGTTPKSITFKASSTGCNARLVKSSSSYPSAAASCADKVGANVSLMLPGGSSAPQFDRISVSYISASGGPITQSAVNMDGTTETTIKAVYENSGGDAYNISFYGRNYGSYNYTVTDNIQYEIGSGPRKTATASQITSGWKIGNGTTEYGFYPAHSEKFKTFTLKLTDPADRVPAGQRLTVYIPTVNGNIYSNGKKNVFYDYWCSTINGYATNITHCENECGDIGTFVNESATIGYQGTPHFKKLPAFKKYTMGMKHTESIHTVTGWGAPITVNVKLPSWLTLDQSAGTGTGIHWTDKQDGTGAVRTPSGPVSSKVDTDGREIYSIEYPDSANRSDMYLHFKLQADATCAGNINDTIHYWFDHYYPNGGPLKYISQVFQPVYFYCTPEGVDIAKFKQRRITKGFSDTDDDGQPDTNYPLLADDSDIRHDVFVEGDEGEFTWELDILSTANYLYIPIKGVGITLGEGGEHISLDKDGYDMTIGTNSKSGLEYISLSGSSGYFFYEGTVNAGDKIIIKTPFKVNKVTDNYNSLEIEALISDIKKNPFEPRGSDFKGVDKLASNFGTYGLRNLHHTHNDNGDVTFPDNTVNHQLGTASAGYVDLFHSGYFGAPYFSNEIRRHNYPTEFKWVLPAGYIIRPTSTMTLQRLHGTFSNNTPHIEAQIDGSSSGNTYIFKFQDKYTEKATPGKWLIPDDYYHMTLKADVIATLAAPLGQSTLNRYATFTFPDGRPPLELHKTYKFNYTGPALNIKTRPVIVSNNITVTKPDIEISNPSKHNIQSLWIYVAGDISDIKFKGSSGNWQPGTGHEKRWFNVEPNFFNSNSPARQIGIEFKNNSFVDCKNKVTIHTAAGINANFAPPSGPFNPDDPSIVINIGPETSFNVEVGKAIVSQTLTVTNNPVSASGASAELTHLKPYDFTQNVNSEGSMAILKDPEILITIPAGQQYEAGSGQIEFPRGETPKPLASAVEAALVAIGEPAQDTTFTLKLAEAFGAEILLEGNQNTGLSNDLRNINFTAKFIPKCASDLNGLLFTSKVKGTNQCGEEADITNWERESEKLYPNIGVDYRFTIDASMASGITAFNEVRTEDTLVVIVRKDKGIDSIKPRDSLQIRLPQSMDITGTARLSAQPGGTMSHTPDTASIGIAVLSDTTRYIKLPLPDSAYNASSNKGVGVGNEITYHIPVRYTPDGQSLAHSPQHHIDAAIIVKGKFGTCPEQDVALGEVQLPIALVTAEHFPFRVLVDSTLTMKITSDGFSGDWFDTENQMTPSATGEFYTKTFPSQTTNPKNTDTLDVYISADFGVNDYGLLPVRVWLGYPAEVIDNVDTLEAYVCDTIHTLSIKAVGLDLTYQWYKNGVALPNDTLPTLDVIDNKHYGSADYHVIVTDWFGNTDQSYTAPVLFNRAPVITKELPKRFSACDKREYVDLTIEAVGTRMEYQWYRNDEAIGAKSNKATYRVFDYETSGIYHVLIYNACGDSTLSQKCYVNFCDQPLWVSRPVVLRKLSGITTEPGAGIHMVEGHDDFVFKLIANDPGQSLRYLTVKTGYPLWDEFDGVEYNHVAHDTLIVTILQVTQPMENLIIEGMTPVDNIHVTEGDDCNFWTYNDKLCFELEEETTVDIYTITGMRYQQLKIEAGKTIVTLPQGMYIIQTKSGCRKKVFIQ